MDDAGRVRRGHAVGNLHRDVEQRPDGDDAAFDRRDQRLAVDQLGGDVRDAVVGADVVNGEDVRMIQRGGGVRLLLEACVPAGVGGDGRGQDLQRHVAAQPCIASAVHLSHPAGSERRDDFVRAETPSGSEGGHPRESTAPPV
jgi:hypothetical protein